MVFPVVMYRWESGTIKKAELWRTDAFELWCWRRLLSVPWTARKSVNPKRNQPWIFLEGLMLKLKLQYFGHLMHRANSLEDPDAGKDWGQEENGTTEDEMVGWHHQLKHEFEQTPGDSERQGSLVCCSPWSCKESDTTKRLNNNTGKWTLLISISSGCWTRVRRGQTCPGVWPRSHPLARRGKCPVATGQRQHPAPWRMFSSWSWSSLKQHLCISCLYPQLW